MKKIWLLSIMIVGFASFSSAQVKPVQSATIKTPNALCADCKVRIESYLRRYDGVTFIDVNFHRGETKVKYLSDRIDIEQIKTALSNLGYDADDVPANADAYKELPKCCKKTEDGGGMGKPKQ